MHIYESIKEKFELAKVNLRNLSGVSIYNHGIGSETKSTKMTARRMNTGAGQSSKPTLVHLKWGKL